MPALHARRKRVAVVEAHAEQTRTARRARPERIARRVRVGDEDRELRVVDRVVELLLGPPGVERHRDRADREDGGEGDDPFGVVAHRDAHSVALLDAEVVHERVAEGVGFAP